MAQILINGFPSSIGVPAAPLAANGGPSGETYYVTPAQLSELIDEYETAPRFGGIMMWSAGFSDSNVNNGCNYAQEAHAILDFGSPCSSGPSSSSLPTPAPTPTPTSTASTGTATPTTTTPTPTGTGTIPQWGRFFQISCELRSLSAEYPPLAVTCFMAEWSQICLFRLDVFPMIGRSWRQRATNEDLRDKSSLVFHERTMEVLLL